MRGAGSSGTTKWWQNINSRQSRKFMTKDCSSNNSRKSKILSLCIKGGLIFLGNRKNSSQLQ